MLAVDGTEPAELRNIMELDLENQADAKSSSQVFESAGGFSPTIGIIGAVLGLIQVMQHLDKIDEVGRGIAVAFVATIYGVGSANLFLLPSAGKLRIRIREEQIVREMTLEGRGVDPGGHESPESSKPSCWGFWLRDNRQRKIRERSGAISHAAEL